MRVQWRFQLSIIHACGGGRSNRNCNNYSLMNKTVVVAMDIGDIAIDIKSHFAGSER